jgi:hypothetical protein
MHSPTPKNGLAYLWVSRPLIFIGRAIFPCMVKRSHHSPGKGVHVHHTIANYLMPLGMIIMATLLGYWSQTEPFTFHQYFKWIVAVGITFGALYILIYHPKHVF